MRRLPHGGTSRPPMARPGSVYGRAPHAGPPARWRRARSHHAGAALTTRSRCCWHRSTWFNSTPTPESPNRQRHLDLRASCRPPTTTRVRGEQAQPPAFEYPGTEEVPVLDWPRIWRERLRLACIAATVTEPGCSSPRSRGCSRRGSRSRCSRCRSPTSPTTSARAESALTWVVSGPMLMLAIAMPLSGKLGDVYGHRRVYLTGFTIFAVFTALCAFAWSAPALITLRVLAALGGAATGPTSMAMIMQAYPAEERVKAMGWWSLVGAGAPVFGVVAGAPLINAFGWRVVVHRPDSDHARRADTVDDRAPRDAAPAEGTHRRHRRGVARDRNGLGPARIGPRRRVGLDQPGRARVHRGRSARVGGLRRASERRASNPLLPLEFFRRPNFTPAIVAQFGSNFAYMGGFIVTPLLMQEVFGYSLSTTGYVMLCRPLTFSLFAPVAGYLTVHVGERFAAVSRRGIGGRVDDRVRVRRAPRSGGIDRRRARVLRPRARGVVTESRRRRSRTR